MRLQSSLAVSLHVSLNNQRLIGARETNPSFYKVDQPHTRVLLYLPVPHHTLNLAREAMLVYVPSTVLYCIAGSLITIINLCCNTPTDIGDHIMVTE